MSDVATPGGGLLRSSLGTAAQLMLPTSRQDVSVTREPPVAPGDAARQPSPSTNMANTAAA